MSLNNRAIYILPASAVSTPLYHRNTTTTTTSKGGVNKNNLNILTKSNEQKQFKNILPSSPNNNQKNITLSSPLQIYQNCQKPAQQYIKVLKENQSLQRITLLKRQTALPITNQTFSKLPVMSPKLFNPLDSKNKKQHGIKRQFMIDSNNEVTDIDDVYELIDNSKELSPLSLNCIPRKRERLTHLSPEEKLNRRKMKNRVAAQTARDRKKERTIRLEHAVKTLLVKTNQLRTENRILVAENNYLKNNNYQSSLSTKQINDVTSNISQKNCLLSPFNVSESMYLEKAFESAEFVCEPQQRDQALQKMTLTQNFNTVITSFLTVFKTILILTLMKILFPLIPQWMMIYKKSLVICLDQISTPILTLINFATKLLIMNLHKIKHCIQILYMKLIAMIQQLRNLLQHSQHSCHIQFLQRHIYLQIIQIHNKNNQNLIHQITKILLKIIMNPCHLIS